MRLAARYIDWTTSDPRLLARRASAARQQLATVGAQDLFLLATCLRIEAYGSPYDVERVTSTLFGDEYRTIEGEDQILHRLALIALGAKSQILGERFIPQQLESACEALGKNAPVRGVVLAALDVARAVQRERPFVATSDYVEVAFDLLEEVGGEPTTRDLCIVGSGMLAREFLLSQRLTRFRRTIGVTRNPKRARKRMRSLVDRGVQFLHPTQLEGWRQGRCLSIMGTAGMTDAYRHHLWQALVVGGAAGIVDFSSIPAFADAETADVATRPPRFRGEYLLTRGGSTTRYITMYHESFLRHVERNNAPLLAQLPAVQELVERHCLAASPSHMRRAR